MIELFLFKKNYKFNSSDFNSNKVIPSFHMTFVSSNSNTTGITSGTGTANPFGFSGALLFNL